MKERGKANLAVALRATLLPTLIIVAACIADSGSYDAAPADGPERAAPAAAAVEQAPAMPSQLREAYIAAAQRDAGVAYRFDKTAADERTLASNGAQGLFVELQGDALRLHPDGAAPRWSAAFSWTGIGRIGSLATPAAVTACHASSNRASLRRADGSEDWYLNGPLGIEQGFTLPQRPAGDAGRLVIEVAVSGDLEPVALAGAKQITLRDRDGKSQLRYTDLVARDASSNKLPAEMEASDGVIRLLIDDREATYPLTIDPLIWAELKKLVASDAAGSDDFGIAVAISGTTAVIGSPQVGSDVGAAYVFQGNEGGLNNWGEVKKITAGDASNSARFGQAVSIGGDTIVIGAPGDASGRGAAYVFRRHFDTSNNWGQTVKLTAGDGAAGDQLGSAVATAGDTAIVGAPGDASGRGSAYVFEREGSGGEGWSQITQFNAADGAAGDSFGASAGISGDTAIVGAPHANVGGANGGAAYTFDRDEGGTDNWGEIAKLSSSDGAGALFGTAVAISGGTAITGAPGVSPGGTAYVFGRDQGGANNWGQLAEALGTDVAAGDGFGTSVGISGDAALVGAPLHDGGAADDGASYVFERAQGGSNNWGQTDKLSGSDGEAGDEFGFAVAVSGEQSVTGAHFEDGGGNNAGAAYAFSFRKDLGDPCGSAGECHSLICADGVCCDIPCGDNDSGDCQACTINGGSPSNGTCVTLADGHVCSDGVFCNGDESCTAGVCGDSPGDPCAHRVAEVNTDCSETCDEEADGCVAPNADGSACTDGKECNGADSCLDGECSVHEGICPEDNAGFGQTEEDEGCGCRVPGGKAPAPWKLAALLGIGLAITRRRRD